jgi:uncharacterized protein
VKHEQTSPTAGSSSILGIDSRTLAFVAPFAVFILFLAIRSYLPFGMEWEYPLRVIVVTAVLVLFSRGVLTLRMTSPFQSVLIGILVFIIWIGPDLLFPGYRSHWLFQNSVVGHSTTATPEGLSANWLFLILRIAGTMLLVPIIEELFWRGWLMRWLIHRDFDTVALGTYVPFAFWSTAALFALEHGSYWDVGFAAGIVYNWWMVRTRCLGDCILAHAVTNGLLAAYVLMANRWEYWL